MFSYPVYNQKGEKQESIKLSAAIFYVDLNESLLHQAVVAQLGNRRKILAKVKTKSEVRGGGRKPWRQKGTGRARHGSIRSPLWRGGGVTFGPSTDRVFKKKINKKMKRTALFMALSSKVKDNELIVVDSLKVTEPKTKIVRTMLDNLIKKKEREKSILIANEKDNLGIVRAARNLSRANTMSISSLNVVDLLSNKYLIISLTGLKEIEKIYLPDSKKKVEK